MNFSAWTDATVGQLRISSRVGTNVIPGVQVRQFPPMGWGWGRIGQAGETIIEPTDKIDIKGELRLGAIGPTNGGDIEIGFIQTMVRCLREARYGNSPHNLVHTFTRSHRVYPVKDGEGTPWYNDRNDNAPNAVLRMPIAPLAKYVAAPNVHISPHVAVYDKPKFGFPSTINGMGVQSVRVEDNFLTCLAVKYQDKYFALHSVVWKFRASMTGPTNPTGAISIVGSGPLPAPYALPPNLVLTGISANRSEIKLWNGAPI